MHMNVSTSKNVHMHTHSYSEKAVSADFCFVSHYKEGASSALPK